MRAAPYAWSHAAGANTAAMSASTTSACFSRTLRSWIGSASSGVRDTASRTTVPSEAHTDPPHAVSAPRQKSMRGRRLSSRRNGNVSGPLAVSEPRSAVWGALSARMIRSPIVIRTSLGRRRIRVYRGSAVGAIAGRGSPP